MTAHEKAEAVKSGLYDEVLRHLSDTTIVLCDLALDRHSSRLPSGRLTVEDEVEGVFDRWSCEEIINHLRIAALPPQ